MTQVIVLNGGSSSGKSSIARALQDVLPKVWLIFGVDAMIEALPGRGDDPRSGLVLESDGTVTVKPEFRSLEDVWCGALAFMAHGGASLILDEILLTGAAGQQRVSASLNGLNVLWVRVHCDPNVAAARESNRPDRIQGMAMTQSVVAHRGVVYDVEVDTTACSAIECARRIALRVVS